MKSVRVLLIQHESAPVDFLPLDLLQGGVRVVTEHAGSATAVEHLLQWFEPDLVLSEFDLPALPGMQALELVRRLHPHIPVVFVADTRDVQQELEALRHGALDYVQRKDSIRMLAAMRHALSEAFERRARREAERALQESEIRFRLFMEHMPGAVYMKDLEGRFTYVNRIAQRFIGRPVAEILGKTLHQLYPPEIADPLVANDQRALQVRQPVQATERTLTADGPRVFLSTKFPVVGIDGQPIMIGGFSIDITSAPDYSL